jgi:hypothetical protein
VLVSTKARCNPGRLSPLFNFLFDPTVFRMLLPNSPPEARPGNLGRNVFYGPGLNNVDLSLVLNFNGVLARGTSFVLAFIIFGIVC